MKKDIIIKENRFCPFCDYEHEVEILERRAITNIKGQMVEYTEQFCQCTLSPSEDNEFVYGKMMNENLRRARDSYRKDNNLLLSTDIINIRKKYKLTQGELSKILGLGDVTIARYETKAIQDRVYDNLMREIQDNPKRMLYYFEQNTNKLSLERRDEIRKTITSYISPQKEPVENISFLGLHYKNYMQPTADNGYVIINEKKISTIVWYLASNIDNLYKIKLAKLLWYIDMLHFKLYGKAVTGLIYRHKPMGALPVGDIGLLTLNNIVVEEEPCDSSFEGIKYHFTPKGMADLNVLSDEEMKIVDMVLGKFKKYSTAEIVDYMHREKVYINTGMNDIMIFNSDEMINDF